jgi:pimeloyl-ACP methyl ester carboxylesterase
LAPPLLLLNGYAATGDDWDPIFRARLADVFDVIAPDPRGMGGAELGDEEMTIELLAADALGLLDARGIERATVAGWSMGGFVAQQLAADAPERVSGLALLSTDPGAEAERADPEVWARLTDHGGEPIEQAARLLNLLFPPEFASGVFAQYGDIVAAARAGLDSTALTAQEAAMDAWHASPGGERLASIAAPTVVLAGELDAVIPPSNSGLLADGLGDARRELLPGCGHALMAQRPERAAELIASVRPG